MSLTYQSHFKPGKKILALLIDPEKQDHHELSKTLEAAEEAGVDMILAGGSLTTSPIDDTLQMIRKATGIPVVLFPGNLLQLSKNADGILLLSLISGRNPEYLIGNHVMASGFLKKSGLEIIPTGYILVGQNNHTSVAYMSNTLPIPAGKTDIILATALAGEQLGLKLIYLEAGSGATEMVQPETVKSIKQELSIPLWVGGGIRTAGDIRNIYAAGADGVVVGNAIEENHSLLKSLAAVRNEFNL